ncbi:CRISPR-associated endonuclease Cas1 [Butyrivibrio sp. YAB3001]|uniref:CRISPR-associated endonuclease Cas1 n=1 Tax=Butyrivibrio sp. YAB3001 TaxID=1520812 RepID=UPI0008F63C34|nr:CRISPR-associated endonuclease Cas1 [Butyrivibrio sp. YAB3001]SFB66471.1 CRISP-associated protein Cas1 [Butyrivibrio sp. YAB3001]
MNNISRWKTSSIEKIDDVYHIISDGKLSRKDSTIVFENEDVTEYLPVEKVKSIVVHSHTTFSSGFFQILDEYDINMTLISPYGETIGRFIPANASNSYETEFKQLKFRYKEVDGLPLKQKFERANINNMLAVLRYYKKRSDSIILDNNVAYITECRNMVKYAKDDQHLMLLEARARHRYYQSFNEVIKNPDFEMKNRSKNPPEDAINAMISFGNTLLYHRFSYYIEQTSLDIRIGLIHNSYHRRESLNLDLADLFKPIIVDRIIFLLINKNIIQNTTEYFVDSPKNNGVYLSKYGKNLFIKEFENKCKKIIEHKGTKMSYEELMKEENKKLERYFKTGKDYIPFSYSN